MASRKPKPKRKAKKPSAVANANRAQSKRVIAEEGPVTLAEAQALVAASRPIAKRAKGKSKEQQATPASVGKARKQLERERNTELARRLRDYTDTLKIMKKRGLRAPAKKASLASSGGVIVAKGNGRQPLQILAEGDSWFDYPVPFFGGGIIPRLENLLGVPILNLAKAGDEVRYMLGVKERKLLAKKLSKGCPAGGAWDVLLFSGGGNDIVDNPMALWVKDWDPTIPPAQHINQARFDAALALVRAGYEDLIALRDQLSPSTHLFFHCYDFAIPDGRGVCFMGPWLSPTFKLRGFPTQNDGVAVVKEMLSQFAGMLNSLVSQNVTVISTQGTLSPNTSSWHNELHPSKAGFKVFASRFQQELKVRFPARVA